MTVEKTDIVYGEISYDSEQRHLDAAISSIDDNVAKILDENKNTAKKITTITSDIRYLDNEQRRDYRSQRASLDATIAENKKKELDSKRIKSSPYFGRIDIDYKDKKISPKSYYLSIHKDIRNILKSHKGVEYVNWRAAIGSQYAMTNRAGEYVFPDGVGAATVQLKSPIVIEKSRVVKIDENNILGKHSRDTDDIDLLQEKLSSSSSAKMSEVVETIQDEQNSIIRIPENKNLIIQGGAGSGKTVVGLHRIAYLMYEGHKNPLKDFQTVFISPNKEFSECISDVLPSLGENNIPILTMNSIISLVLKGSGYSQNDSYIQKYYKDSEIDEEIKALYSSSLSERFSDLVDMIKDDLKFYDDLVERAEWHHIEIKATKQGYQKYLEDADFLEPFRNRINGSVYTKAGVYEAIIKAMLTKAVLKSFINSSGEIDFMLVDDGVREIDRNTLRFNEKMEDEGTPEKKKQLIDRNTNGIRQVVIDEAQDYTKWHIFLLRQVFPNAHFTILGDENQNINPYIENNKLKQLASDFEYIEIKKAYRSSPEIVEFTNKILNANIKPVRKSAGFPVKEYWNLNKTLKSVRNQMIIWDLLRYKDNGHKRVAIITRNNREAKEIQKLNTGDNSFICLPVFRAKGLEFDAVIVLDSFLDNEKEMYYTACTRAQHELTVYHGESRNIYEK